MEATIQVKFANTRGDWCNIKTVEGKEVSVNLPKCPNLKQAIEAAQDVPYTLNGNMVEKDGKAYLWDSKPQGEKKAWGGQPKDEPFIAAQSVFSSICTLHAGSSTAGDIVSVLEDFETAYKVIMSKKTL